MTGLSTARIHSEPLQVIQSHEHVVNKKPNKLNKQTNKPVKHIPKVENTRLFLQRGIGQLFIY